MTKHGLTAIVAALAVLMTLFCVSCAGATANQRPFASNGERIYFTGKSSSGKPVRHSGGLTFLFSQSNCAACHGADGRGNPDINVPAITWITLAGEDEHNHARFPWWYGKVAYAHSAHKYYTETTLKVAITDGVRPDGIELNKRMPRWQMPPADLDDLVAFMKTL